MREAKIGSARTMKVDIGVPIAIIHHPSVRTPQRANDSTNLYILNLAFCDFLFCLVVAPLFMVHYVYEGWPLGQQRWVTRSLTPLPKTKQLQ